MDIENNGGACFDTHHEVVVFVVLIVSLRSVQVQVCNTQLRC